MEQAIAFKIKSLDTIENIKIIEDKDAIPSDGSQPFQVVLETLTRKTITLEIEYLDL